EHHDADPCRRFRSLSGLVRAGSWACPLWGLVRDRCGLIGGISFSTSGGNPVSTAAGNAVVDYVLDHDLQANATRVGTILLNGLLAVAAESAVVAEVRGRGLMIGLGFV